jgi:chorismate synthase
MLNKINFLTAGESHGKGLLGIIEGIPSGLKISEDYINFHLSRRQKGFGRGGRMKIENDLSEIYSGVRLGNTIGAPIGLIIKNLDSVNWVDIMPIDSIQLQPEKITLPRPGHADLAGIMKHDFDDIRNVIERSSARETTMRVALGSICRKLLEECNIYIASYVTAIHNTIDTSSPAQYNVKTINSRADKSSVRSLNPQIEKKMIETIKSAQKNGDTVGGQFRVLVSGAPYGLGSYSSWNKKINAKLSEAICSINAIKGVYFGADNASDLFGSQLHDEIGFEKGQFTRVNNNAGGIEGGMTNAQTIIINGVMKPLSTLSKPLKSVDIKSKEYKLAHKERTDSCAVPAAAIVAESMVALVIADTLLDKFGGDSLSSLNQHLQSAKY